MIHWLTINDNPSNPQQPIHYICFTDLSWLCPTSCCIHVLLPNGPVVFLVRYPLAIWISKFHEIHPFRKILSIHLAWPLMILFSYRKLINKLDSIAINDQDFSTAMPMRQVVLRQTSPKRRPGASGDRILDEGTVEKEVKNPSSWWFGIWLLWLSIIYGNNPSQLTFIFFRGVETTNQPWFLEGKYEYGTMIWKWSVFPLLSTKRTVSSWEGNTHVVLFLGLFEYMVDLYLKIWLFWWDDEVWYHFSSGVPYFQTKTKLRREGSIQNHWWTCGWWKLMNICAYIDHKYT